MPIQFPYAHEKCCENLVVAVEKLVIFLAQMLPLFLFC